MDASVLSELWTALLASSPRELVAMILAIAYLLLAVRQNIWCWAAAFVSTVIYTFVFAGAGLYMDSGLQVFYALMAIYGWSQWRSHGDASADLRISTRSLQWHGVVIVAVLLLSAISGYWLANHTAAAFPYLDSFTTWASVITTWMVARKVLENWLYWIVIDSVSLLLYINRELLLTVVLFALYIVIAVLGWRSWSKAFEEQEQ